MSDLDYDFDDRDYTAEARYQPAPVEVGWSGIGVKRIKAWAQFDLDDMMQYVVSRLEDFTDEWEARGKDIVGETGIQRQSGDLLNEYYVRVDLVNTSAFGTRGGVPIEIEFGSTAEHRGTRYPWLLEGGFTHLGGGRVGPYYFFTLAAEEMAPEAERIAHTAIQEYFENLGENVPSPYQGRARASRLAGY